MQEKELKTSWKQRIVIGFIAFLLLFSTVAIYALIVLSGEKTKEVSSKNEEKLAEIEGRMTEKRNEIDNAASELSGNYFEALNEARKEHVKSYNAANINSSGLSTEDLKEGDGQEITGESKYYSYYIGWCADESVFDSSFDSTDNPTTLKTPLYYAADQSLIAGWLEGVVGMKTGGIREISIPGELAYGESREICGGTNSPLKFLVYVVDPGEAYDKLQGEYDEIYQEYVAAYYSSLQTTGN